MLAKRRHQALSIFLVVSTGACFRTASTLSRSLSRHRRIFMEDTLDTSIHVGWKDLCVSKDELSLDLTLNMGQCFNWKKVEHTNDTCWIGLLGTEPLLVKQTPTTAGFISLRQPTSPPINNDLNQVMRQYFQLDHNLNNLYAEWGQGCERMKVVTQCLKGARVLRQDPWECLVSFICSSNNNIPRIIQMLEKLRRRYGKYVCSVQAIKVSELQPTHAVDLPLPQWSPPGLPMDDNIHERYKWVVSYDAPNVSSLASSSTNQIISYELFEFPTVSALADAAEEDLRALGMGYRAKYIINSAKLVRSKCAEAGVKDEVSGAPTGNFDNGAEWFEHLRSLAAEARRGSTIKTEHTNMNHVVVKQEDEIVVKSEPELTQHSSTPMSTRARFAEDPITTQQIDTARLQVQALLLELPGVGRKVADCVALFALDQTSAVPVDTHVWNIAIRDYAPQLRRAAVKSEPDNEGAVKLESNAKSDTDALAISTPVNTKKGANNKRSRGSAAAFADPLTASPLTTLQSPSNTVSLPSAQNTPAEVDSIETRSLTPAVYEAVGAEFRRRFGNHAGWAHSVLFAAELGVFKDRLPVSMQTEMKAFAELQRSAKKVKREEKMELKKNTLGL